MLLDFLNNYKTEIFVATVVIVHYLLYILLYFEINIISKYHVDILNTILQIYISSFLIYKFVFVKNNSVISSLDKRVITSSATFMLLNVLAREFSDYFTNIHTLILKSASYPSVKPTQKVIYDYLPVNNI